MKELGMNRNGEQQSFTESIGSDAGDYSELDSDDKGRSGVNDAGSDANSGGDVGIGDERANYKISEFENVP
ncbi:hypothetical protein QVD17_17594 [Tagetes erecta]|uniref:Uncharacterized protein n=1 Tax=Tagetes erecta TaxID=13708 RepID=A0AAD8KU81_TARER|nr:hypothetical protein QVD17_17594 [Tagetes erecta]